MSREEEFLPKLVHFDITNACNLKCLHCRNADSLPLPSELSVKELIGIVDQVNEMNNDSIEYLGIGGGEPFVVFDKLLEFLKRTNDKVKVKGREITSNGTLITKDRAKHLKDIVKSALRIQVSLDGATEETHEKIRGKGSWKKAFQGIEALKDANFKVSFRMTISKYNCTEIEDLCKLAVSKEINQVNFREVIPCGRATKNSFLYSSLNLENYKRLLEDIPRLEEEYNLRIYSGDPLALTVNSKILKEYEEELGNTKLYAGCSCGISYLYIDAEGKVHPCPAISKVLGDVRKEPISKIWKNSNFYKRIRERNFKKCRDCKFRYFCGGCRAFAYNASGDYFGEDPRCFSFKKKQW